MTDRIKLYAHCVCPYPQDKMNFEGELTDLIQRALSGKSKELQEREKTIKARENKVDRFLAAQQCNDYVHLRVGQEIFYCSMKKLLSKKDSYFHAISEDLKNQERTFFIPRDSATFKYVLEYLNYGELVTPPESANTLRKLLLDAEFYGLGELKSQVEDFMEIKDNACDENRTIILHDGKLSGSCQGIT